METINTFKRERVYEQSNYTNTVMSYKCITGTTPPPPPPPPPPPVQLPTVNISANPTLVNYNGASTISWNSNNATSCNATGEQIIGMDQEI